MTVTFTQLIWFASHRLRLCCTMSWVVACKASEFGANSSCRSPQPNSGRSTPLARRRQQDLPDHLVDMARIRRLRGLAGDRVDPERESIVVSGSISETGERSGSLAFSFSGQTPVAASSTINTVPCTA